MIQSATGLCTILKGSSPPQALWRPILGTSPWSWSAGLYAEALARIFKQWNFDSILPCHGDYVAKDGKKILQEHLELVGERKRLIAP